MKIKIQVDPPLTLFFSGDPTADGDVIAAAARRWYEANRESWWERHRPQIFSYRSNSGVVADEFMLRFLEVARLLESAYEAFKITKHKEPANGQ